MKVDFEFWQPESPWQIDEIKRHYQPLQGVGPCPYGAGEYDRLIRNDKFDDDLYPYDDLNVYEGTNRADAVEESDQASEPQEASKNVILRPWQAQSRDLQRDSLQRGCRSRQPLPYRKRSRK